jgi:hypothetical protein
MVKEAPTMRTNPRVVQLLQRCVPVLATAVFLFSCAAKKSVAQLTVEIPADFSGQLRIHPCRAGAPSEHLMADPSGQADTSTCLQGGEQVDVVVVRSGRAWQIPSSQMELLRAGDGMVVEIRANTQQASTQQ